MTTKQHRDVKPNSSALPPKTSTVHGGPPPEKAMAKPPAGHEFCGSDCNHDPHEINDDLDTTIDEIVSGDYTPTVNTFVSELLRNLELDLADVNDLIGRLAYKLWEKEGRPDGRDVIHWYAAEAIITNAIEPGPTFAARALIAQQRMDEERRMPAK